jgi:hypothetical protein
MNKPTHDRKVPASEAPNRRAGLRRDELLPGETTDDTGTHDHNMSGTAGGGLAAGGMGGTNAGDGSTDDVDIEGALGGSPADTNGDKEDTQDPQSGRSGGAVGGTPAGKRVSRQ